MMIVVNNYKDCNRFVVVAAAVDVVVVVVGMARKAELTTEKECEERMDSILSLAS
jgi:hypothetical protein